MKTVAKALRLTFKTSRYKIFALIIFALSFFISLLVSHIITLISYFLLGSPFSDKLLFFVNYVKSVIFYTTSPLTLIHTTIVIALFTINLVMFVYVYRRARSLFGSGQIVTTSVIGFLVSLMGIGCFSCGAFVLAYILGIFGASSVIYMMPLHGAEVIIIGIVVLSASIYTLSKKLISLTN